MNNSTETDADGGLIYIKFGTPTEFVGGNRNLEWTARTKTTADVTVISQTVTNIRQNLIGLDLVVGPSRDGTRYTIRDMNFVFDY